MQRALQCSPESLTKSSLREHKRVVLHNNRKKLEVHAVLTISVFQKTYYCVRSKPRGHIAFFFCLPILFFFTSVPSNTFYFSKAFADKKHYSQIEEAFSTTLKQFTVFQEKKIKNMFCILIVFILFILWISSYLLPSLKDSVLKNIHKGG